MRESRKYGSVRGAGSNGPSLSRPEKEIQDFEFGFRSAGFGFPSIRLGFPSEKFGFPSGEFGNPSSRWHGRPYLVFAKIDE